MGARILIVDDEPMVRDVVSRYLQREGFTTDVASDGATALTRFGDGAYDLVVLDLMLPRLAGEEVLGRIRARSEVPVILLTAKGETRDRIDGLELGADDYLTKPFSPRELVARIRAVLRRATPAEPDRGPIAAGHLVIDARSRRVTLRDADVDLTPREFDLLAFLAKNAGRAYSREELLREVWSSSTEWQDPGTVTVHIRRLRRKVEDDPMAPAFLATVWGVGYRFDVPAMPAVP